MTAAASYGLEHRPMLRQELFPVDMVFQLCLDHGAMIAGGELTRCKICYKGGSQWL